MDREADPLEGPPDESGVAVRPRGDHGSGVAATHDSGPVRSPVPRTAAPVEGGISLRKP